MKGRMYERKGFWVKDLLVTRLHQSLQEDITWMKYCFRKMYLAAGIQQMRWEGWKQANELDGYVSLRTKSQKQTGVSQDEERVDSGNEGRIKLRLSSKSQSLTRSIMVPMRELDASGRLFVFLNQWCTLSIHVKFKVTVAISGRQTAQVHTHIYICTGSHCKLLATYSFHLAFKALCNPTPIISSNFSISVHLLQPNCASHSSNNGYIWFTKRFHTH